MDASFWAGALGGLFTVIILVFLLPRRWGHLRPVIAALAGGIMAWVLMTYVK